MSKANVADLCNPDLFSVSSTMPATRALAELQARGIHGAPVVMGPRAVGVITLGDLTGDLEGVFVGDRMTEPNVAIEGSSTIEEAAAAMVRHAVHHLVVTERGEVRGFLSAVDLLRGVLDG